MIKLSLETKTISVIRGLETLRDPLLLFGEGTWIFSSNSDRDGERIGTYAKHQDGYGDVNPFPFLSHCHPFINHFFIKIK